MTYNKETHIKDIKDVEAFFRYLIFEKKLNFHPDDSFNKYMNYKTNEAVFSPEECELYDRLMDESFEICEKEHEDIYKIGLDNMIMSLTN